MFHESSKQHLDKMREALERSKGRGKGPNPGDIRQLRDKTVLDELKRIEEAAYQSFDAKDAAGVSLNGRYRPLERPAVQNVVSRA